MGPNLFDNPFFVASLVVALPMLLALLVILILRFVEPADAALAITATLGAGGLLCMVGAAIYTRFFRPWRLDDP